MKPLPRTHRILLAALAAFGLNASLPAAAQSTLADPFKDPRYMSGYRDIAPPAVPEELSDADALTRIQGTRRISVCGDPYAFPATEITDEPRGYDVDLIRLIAQEEGWETQFVWVNTANRGGLNRAFRTTIRKGVCDVFLGLGTGGMAETLARSRLTLLQPNFGVAYVLVTFDPALDGLTLAQLAAAGTRVGATYFSPGETILESQGVEHEAFPQARRAIEAMAQRRIDAALVPSTSLAEARRDYPDRKARVLGSYEPSSGLQWNTAWAVREKESALKAFLESKLREISTSGRLKALLETYGIPYFPPVGVSDAASGRVSASADMR
jgi:ABC-type amino acid transport substrate-binding protein